MQYGVWSTTNTIHKTIYGTIQHVPYTTNFDGKSLQNKIKNKMT